MCIKINPDIPKPLKKRKKIQNMTIKCFPILNLLKEENKIKQIKQILCTIVVDKREIYYAN